MRASGWAVAAGAEVEEGAPPWRAERGEDALYSPCKSLEEDPERTPTQLCPAGKVEECPDYYESVLIGKAISAV